MAQLYPEIEPYDTGMLEVGDGNAVYWEVSGNPDGKLVVFLHGGPGGGTEAGDRRFFDPRRYRIVLLDQRNCGRSTPSAGAFDTDLSANTTWHLVADLELLRTHLGIGRWQVFGGSWGSALALAYAQRHPERVAELVLRGIFTVRPAELLWLYEGLAGNVYPEAWQRFVAPVPHDQRVPGNFVAAYAGLLADPDPEVHGPAAAAWTTWEANVVTLLPDPDLLRQFSDPTFALTFARIENHYFAHAAWLERDQLIADAHRIAHLPTVIVQGRYDMCTPAVTAHDLHRALPDAELVMIDDAGHASSEPGIRRALVEATDRFAGAT